MVLRTLAAGRERGVSLVELVRSTGLTRPTAHRIVHVLIEEGIVEKNKKTKCYAIGHQVPELALARQSRPALLVAAEPHVAAVAMKLEDTTFLTFRTGFDTLCVARRLGAYPIQVLSIEVGARRPLGVGSAGVAMLAGMSPAEADKIITANQVRFQPYRTNVVTARGEVKAARQKGYSLRDVGLVPGTKSVSTWIKGPDGQPKAAITISTIRTRLNSRREPEVVEVLLEAARNVERALRARKAS